MEITKYGRSLINKKKFELEASHCPRKLEVKYRIHLWISPLSFLIIKQGSASENPISLWSYRDEREKKN